MASKKYIRNHYVPQWYQRRFFAADQREQKFAYLDLSPKTFRDAKDVVRTRKALRRWGTPRCFCQNDLYTTTVGSWSSTEIEERFFGEIDRKGRHAVEYMTSFEHPSADQDAFWNLLLYMSTQKLRTPKGLTWLSNKAKASRNRVLHLMQAYQQMYCASWTECIWQIATASESEVKFIVSDHPVTVYNRGCFPFSQWCRGVNDPDIALHGTHTLFPLSLEKILIFTNLSWVRNPYQNPTRIRPNPRPFRRAMFSFSDIQTHRQLTEIEVCEINFIIKKRAFRHIAAAQEEWLYPERRIPTQHWRNLGGGHLLMPDPRSVSFSREVIIGYKDGRTDSFDEYGRKPWQEGYNDEELADREWETFHRFQGEFARRHGPERRGRSYQFDRLDPERDDDEYHQHVLSQEAKYRSHKRPRNRRSTV